MSPLWSRQIHRDRRIGFLGAMTWEGMGSYCLMGTELVFEDDEKSFGGDGYTTL